MNAMTESRSKVHYFNPEYQLILGLVSFEFYGKQKCNLWEVSSAVRDDTYLTEEEIAAGQKGWMSCGSLYFREREYEKAEKAFERWKIEQIAPLPAEVGAITSDDVPASDESINKIRKEILSIREELMHCPPGSVGRLLLALSRENLNSQVRMRDPSMPLIVRKIESLKHENHIQGYEIVSLIPES